MRSHDCWGRGLGEAMSNTLDLIVSIGSSGDTTPKEVGDAAGRLYVSLASRPEIIGLRQVNEPAPDAAKSGGEVAALGSMLLQVAPSAVEAVLSMIRDLLSRPGALPTKVTVTRKDRQVSVELDPRRTSTTELAALVAELDPR